MISTWNLNGIKEPIEIERNGRKIRIRSKFNLEVTKCIMNDLGMTTSYEDPFKIHNEDFIFVGVDTRKKKPIFPKEIVQVNSLRKDLAQGSGGIVVALSGKFRRVKMKAIAIDERLALGVRLEFSIPLLIIGLYLPSKGGRDRTRAEEKEEENEEEEVKREVEITLPEDYDYSYLFGSSSSTSPLVDSTSSRIPTSSSSRRETNRVGDYACSRFGPKYREQILKKIIKVIEKNPDCRVILAGDLNTNLPIEDNSKERDLFLELESKGMVSVRTVVRSDTPLPCSQPNYSLAREHRQIDHILMSESLSPTNIQSNKYDVSDHTNLSVHFHLPEILTPRTPMFNPNWTEFERILAQTEVPECLDVGTWIDEVQSLITDVAKKTTRKKKKRKVASFQHYQYLIELKTLILKIARSSPRSLNLNGKKYMQQLWQQEKRLPYPDPKEGNEESTRRARSDAFDAISFTRAFLRKEVSVEELRKKALSLHKTIRKCNDIASYDELKKVSKLRDYLYTKNRMKALIDSLLERKLKETPSKEDEVKIAEIITETMTNSVDFNLATFNRHFPGEELIEEPQVPVITRNDLLLNAKRRAKTPGPSRFSLAYLMKAPEKWQTAILDSLIKCWERRVHPPSWLVKKLVLLPKKPNPSFKDFRPISLLEDLRKLLLGTLIRKSFNPRYLADSQHGFRADRSTDSACAVLSSTILTSSQIKSPLILISLDIKKAFDSIPWSALPHLLCKMGVHEEVTDYILSFERIGEGIIGEDAKVKSKAGVPQGSVEGPLFWSAFFNPLLIKLSSFSDPRHYYEHTNIAFADDVIIMAKTTHGIETLMREVRSFLQRTGMKLSENKCMIMHNRKVSEVPRYNFQNIGGRNFLYLGRYFSANLSSRIPVEVYEKFEEIKKAAWLLVKKRVSPEITLYIFQMVLFPKLLYALKFIKNPNPVILEMDNLMKKIMKNKLRVPVTTPDALLHAPLGSWSAGIKPFYMYFFTSRMAAFNRLATGDEPTREAIRVIAPYLLGPVRCSTRGAQQMSLSSFLVIPDSEVPLSHHVCPTRLSNDVVKRIRHYWDNGDVLLQIVERGRRNEGSIHNLRIPIPWSCEDDDETRQALSAYLVCLRLKQLNKLSNCTFESKDLMGSMLSFKTRKLARSLKVENSDLLNEIFLTDAATGIPVIERDYKLGILARTDLVRTDDLRFPRCPPDITVKIIKERVTESVFEMYLEHRERNSLHKDADWPNMDWKLLREVWVHSSFFSTIHLRHLRILFEHEPCGKTLEERRYDPTKKMYKLFDDPFEEINNIQDESFLITPEYTDEDTDSTEAVINEEDKEDEEKEDEEKEDEEKDEEEEKEETKRRLFQCKHCNVSETVSHWIYECPENPVDIHGSLINTIENDNVSNNFREEAVKKAKELLFRINRVKNTRKKARIYRGNLHQVGLPNISRKATLIIVKALRTLILARWYARCLIKHSDSNPFKKEITREHPPNPGVT